MRFRGLVAIVLAILALEAWRVLTPPAALEAGPRVVDIPAQEGLVGIAARLAGAGTIRSPEGFVALSLLRGSARSLKAGEYEVEPDATTVDVLRLLESGRVRRHAVLHPEGASVEELARTLEEAGLAQADEILRVAGDPEFLRAHGIEADTAEGYLFPDTYYLVRGMPAEQILARMVERLWTKLDADTRARADERQLTVHELLTLASIIEREAVVDDERRLISAVFWNRLRRGIPLQADPTVQYAVGKGRRALARADLRTDHPYNTYQRVGLPPGPIANAGLSAIAAALDPAPVKYLYFVAKDDQRHHFSVTIEEHLSAVARYRVVRTR